MDDNTVNTYIAGALGGMAGIVVGHPFDTTKVQLQTAQTSAPYKGTLDALRNVYQHGMSQGLFRGMGFPLFSYGAVNSVFFGTYNLAKNKMLDGEERQATNLETYLAGCIGGFVQLSVACPVDLVKVILQSQISRKTGAQGGQAANKLYFKGPVQCTSWVLRNHGVRGLYKGNVSMLYRDVPTFGVYTLVYEWLFSVISAWSMTDEHGVVASLLAGGSAGVTTWTLAIPFDNVKSLLQADTKGTQFTGTWQCITHIYRHKGARGFFTGLPVCAFRAFPVNAITFLVYSQSLKYLNAHNVQ